MRPLLISLLVTLAVTGCKKREPFVAAEIPKLDVHTHIQPGSLPAAMELLGRSGIRGVVNLSGDSGVQLQQQLAAAKAFPGRVAVFANLSDDGFLGPGWVERELAALEEAKRLGVRGLKLFKALGLGYVDPAGERVRIDDPRLDPIFEACGRLGLVVAIHSGDPRAYFEPLDERNERWDELKANPLWSFHDPIFPRWEELLGEYERRVARHPNTTFIGVHFGNAPEDPARVAAMLDRYPNLYVDTAARVPEIGRMKADELRSIFLEHRTRILFGSDFQLFGRAMVLGSGGDSQPGPADADRFFAAHWRFFESKERQIEHPTPIQGRWKIDAIGLPEEVLRDVYHRNAERLLGLRLDAGGAVASPQ